MHEPNDIFHSSSSDRDNACSSGVNNKKRSNSGGGGAGMDGCSNSSNPSDEYSVTSHKRAKSENGKNISTLKESNNSPPLPG